MSLFWIFFLFCSTSRNSRYKNLQVAMMNKRKLLRCPKTKRSRYGLRRKMKISEVSEFSILSYAQNWKLGNLGNMSLLSSFDSSYNSRFRNDKNMKLPKNWKVPIWFKRKNKNFQDSRVFDFALYPRSKTQKSLEFCLPRILALVVTQDLKTPKKWTETKTKSLDII